MTEAVGRCELSRASRGRCVLHQSLERRLCSNTHTGHGACTRVSCFLYEREPRASEDLRTHGCFPRGPVRPQGLTAPQFWSGPCGEWLWWPAPRPAGCQLLLLPTAGRKVRAAQCDPTGWPGLRTGSCAWPSPAGVTLDGKPLDRGTSRAALRIRAEDAWRGCHGAPVRADLSLGDRSTWKRPWHWDRLRAGGDRDDRGGGGRVASPTPRTCI